MDHNAAKPATVALDATGGLLKIDEQLGGTFDFQNATTLIALQSKKLARRFRLTDAAAKALVPFVYGEIAR
jgi:hypothetical protein